MNVCILTEGGNDIGYGHITRCTSIYQGFEKSAIESQFIVNGDNYAKRMLEGLNCQVFDWLSNRERLFAILKNTDIVFIDSYLADCELYESVSLLIKTAVYFDDTERIEYPRGIILNGTVGAEEMYLPRRKEISYLLGTKFTPLRESFWDTPFKAITPQLRNVLITLGGTDQQAQIERLLELLAKKFADLTYHIVLPFQGIADCCFPKDLRIKTYLNLDEKEMRDLMLKCDICISAGGQTIYELVRVGVPTIGVCFADNQRLNLQGWHKRGVVECLGWYNDDNFFEKAVSAVNRFMLYEERFNRSEIGKKYMDGQGVKRIINYVTTAANRLN
jgi:UDP-2,4-diacetamido-2,4,6-trideoxy-beta-L-altropyranose hydrolase